MQRSFYTQQSPYTEKLLRREPIAQSKHTEAFTQRSFCTEKIYTKSSLRIKDFTHGRFYAERPYPQHAFVQRSFLRRVGLHREAKLLHRESSTRSNPLHREASTENSFYKQNLLHRENSTQRKKFLHREPSAQKRSFAHSSFYAQRFFFTQKTLTQGGFISHTQAFLHKEAFTLRSLCAKKGRGLSGAHKSNSAAHTNPTQRRTQPKRSHAHRSDPPTHTDLIQPRTQI